MRPPRTVRAVAPLAAAALVLAGCSGSGDDPARSVSSTASSGTPSPSGEPSTPSPTARVKGAPSGLRDAVAERYGAKPVDGQASLGRWRGRQIAVVTAGRDVTLAVGPKVGRKSGAWRVVGGWWPSLGAKGEADLGGRRHVMLIGSDARPGETVGRARADALQLLGVDGKGGAGVMGFARDLWVPIPGHGQGKLNSAMVYGGPEAQVAAVRSLTGIRPAGYVLADFKGFKKAVDEVGGLGIVLPDGLRSHMTGGRLPKGEQTLSGHETLILARERKSLPGGDFDRSANQGLVVGAGILQARLAGPQRLPRLLTVADKHVTSDLSAEEVLQLAAWFYRVQPDKVGRAVAKGGFGTRAGQSVVLLDTPSRRAITDFRDGRITR